MLNIILNDNQDTTLECNDEGLIMIEDKIHELCDKSFTDFELPASNRNNSNSNMDPLEEALRKPYDFKKSGGYTVCHNHVRTVWFF